MERLSEIMRMIIPWYCETPLHPGAHGFPVEPVNTWTNIIIMVFGAVAIYQAFRRSRSWGPLLVAVWILITGAASFAWHGYRTPELFLLDAIPGEICLLTLLFFWLRKILSWQKIIGVAGLLIAGQVLAMSLVRIVPGWNLAIIIAFVAVLGWWLAAETSRVSVEASAYAKWMVIAALVALISRTIDATGAVCPFIPFGTHFLWHLSLSLAGFLGVHMLMKIEQAQA